MALSLQAKPSQAKPNNTYYQTDKSPFAKRGISEITNAFSGKSAGKGVFCFIKRYRYVILSASEESDVVHETKDSKVADGRKNQKAEKL